LKPTSRSLLRGPSAALPQNAGEHDFDFLHGRWNVRHRLLRARGADCKDWDDYHGTADTRPLLDGLCNVEEHCIPGRDSGVALRCFDKPSSQWAIYWVSERDGVLSPPVYGRFNGPEGLFEGEDTHDGRAIKVRFVWRELSVDQARWEQAFSFDDGKAWETNWIMQFDRAEHSSI
jgi:hypothetical protein